MAAYLQAYLYTGPCCDWLGDLCLRFIKDVYDDDQQNVWLRRQWNDTDAGCVLSSIICSDSIDSMYFFCACYGEFIQKIISERTADTDASAAAAWTDFIYGSDRGFNI